ncbi:AAA family ATPase [candidate division KSB1 bacterium]|nr:AAA family ATPase [candidate division KSB1 bacterium]
MEKTDQIVSKRFNRGLVVGKFSPLHKGHELVVRHALDTCNNVIIISYSNPEIPGCDSAAREKWLKRVFPQTTRLVVTNEVLQYWREKGGEYAEIPANDSDESVHRRFVGFLCRQVLGIYVDAVFTSEDYGDGFAAELSHYFQGFDPALPMVSHVSVDPERSIVPISASLIRSDVDTWRDWLSPEVYASFVRRVCLLGGESSGKSVLSEILARYFDTAFVPEFGRELWEKKNGVLHFEDLSFIAKRQIELEESAILLAKRFLFCDTSPLTTLFYCLHMFGKAEPLLMEMAKRSYDLVVLCAPDFPFVQDGTRQDEHFRMKQHEWYLQELKKLDIDFLLATGSIESRIKKISEVLELL